MIGASGVTDAALVVADGYRRIAIASVAGFVVYLDGRQMDVTPVGGPLTAQADVRPSGRAGAAVAPAQLQTCRGRAVCPDGATLR
jgi:hypothetical protein